MTRVSHMTISYDAKTFRGVSNSNHGDVSDETVFEYRQERQLVSATYRGGSVVLGQLIAIASEEGELDVRYHHVNIAGDLMTGICHSVPEVLPNGKIRLHETWKWTSGDGSAGESVVEEV